MNSPDSGRLGELVKRRRLDVSRNVDTFAEQVGVHKRTIQAIEYAERKITKSTKYRLERALYWAPGSVDRVLDGGDPIELPLPVPKESPLSRKGAAQLVAEITERLTELASRIRPDDEEDRDPPILIAGRDGVPHAYEVPGVMIADIPPFGEEDDDDERKAEG